MKASAILAAGLVAAVAACSSDPEVDPDGVAVTSNQFTPGTLNVAPATTVTWSWQDGTHDVTFEDGVGDSARNKSGGTHTRSFATAGTYRYRCTIHSTDFTSGMVGTVTVQ